MDRPSGRPAQGADRQPPFPTLSFIHSPVQSSPVQSGPVNRPRSFGASVPAYPPPPIRLGDHISLSTSGSPLPSPRRMVGTRIYDGRTDDDDGHRRTDGRKTISGWTDGRKTISGVWWCVLGRMGPPKVTRDAGGRPHGDKGERGDQTESGSGR
jgi:hypothetical protein